MRDFNARNTLWDDTLNNTKGLLLLNTVLLIWNDDSPIIPINKPIHFHILTSPYSYPNFPPDTYWHIHNNLCSNDHYPDVLNILKQNDSLLRKHWIYNRADWKAFSSATKNIHSLLDSSKDKSMSGLL